MLINDVERAILVGVRMKGPNERPLEQSLAELSSLAGTAGARVVGHVTQTRDKPDLKYYVGEGKVGELKAMVGACSATMVIFDNELGPAQVRNLEEELQVKAVDRTSLILDIFAQHAHSREGKLQVELAQHNYSLTHLVGRGVLMSRLGGGIATRGPGETKLEMDRRVIRSRIALLRRELEGLRAEREVKRTARKAALLPLVAIVGYTNSGKSTLLNALTGSRVAAEDKLFATLDPTTRKLALPSGLEALVTDTVGFIHDLPHQLIEAFHATLEEVSHADLLMHVVDSSSPVVSEEISSVFRVLEEIGAISKPVITVFNKKDLLGNKKLPLRLKRACKPYVEVSAAKGVGLDELLVTLDGHLAESMGLHKFEVPMDRMDIVHMIHEKGMVRSERYLDKTVVLEARVNDATASRFSRYLMRRRP